jgi:hypothetical protein
MRSFNACCATLCLMLMVGSAHAMLTDAQVDKIVAASIQLCKDVPLYHGNINAALNAEVPKVLKAAGLKVSGNASTGFGYGLPTADLAQAMRDADRCRLDAARLFIDHLDAPVVAVQSPSPSQGHAPTRTETPKATLPVACLGKNVATYTVTTDAPRKALPFDVKPAIHVPQAPCHPSCHPEDGFTADYPLSLPVGYEVTQRDDGCHRPECQLNPDEWLPSNADPHPRALRIRSRTIALDYPVHFEGTVPPNEPRVVLAKGEVAPGKLFHVPIPDDNTARLEITSPQSGSSVFLASWLRSAQLPTFVPVGKPIPTSGGVEQNLRYMPRCGS